MEQNYKITDSDFVSHKKLSLLKAEAVFKYFISTGLNGDNFEIVGRGEDFPIEDNKSENGRRANRRVVLIRVKQVK